MRFDSSNLFSLDGRPGVREGPWAGRYDVPSTRAYYSFRGLAILSDLPGWRRADVSPSEAPSDGELDLLAGLPGVERDRPDVDGVIEDMRVEGEDQAERRGHDREQKLDLRAGRAPDYAVGGWEQTDCAQAEFAEGARA